MPKVFASEKGFAPILMLLVLLAGLGIAIYLVLNQQVFKSKASGETIQIVDSSGNPVTTTMSQTVKVKLSPTSQISQSTGLNIESANAATRPDVSSSPTPKGYVRVLGMLFNSTNPSAGVESYIEYCDPAKNGALTKIQTDSNGSFSFNIQKSKNFCIKAPLVNGYLKPIALNARSQDKLSYESQIAGLDCSVNKTADCKPVIVKSLDLATDDNFTFSYAPIVTPSLIPTSTPAPTPVVVSAILAEDPNFGANLMEISLTQIPMVIDYTFSTSNPGNKLIYAKFNLSDGSFQNATPFPAQVQLIAPTPSPSTMPQINKKVLLLIYNPIIESLGNQKLTTVKNWFNPDTVTQNIISEIGSASEGMVNYTISQRIELDKIPTKIDNFAYSDQTYLDCVTSGGSICHNPDQANYLSIINEVDACGKRDRGEIDELWVWGGPWFGFWESNLAGGGAFYLNSGPTLNSSCQKLLPIMGFNYEVSGDPLHTMGHRVESTMTYVYGGWEENRTNHNWDKFGLVKAQSPNYNFSGCGSIHYAPNAVYSGQPGEPRNDDYEYNLTNQTLSTCDDFLNYPNLGDPTQTAKLVSCQAWGCTAEGYHRWWFQHLPKKPGTGPDGKLNNWWVYLMDPQTALPQPGTFNNLSANFAQNTATFNFSYSGTSNSYIVDLSTSPTHATDVYLNFTSGPASPITITNPTKWDKYSCGRILYVKIYNSDRSVSSSIGQATVQCL